MRVLCVGNRYPPHSEGGYEIVFQGAVRALRAAGHDVRVLTSDVVGPAPAGAPEHDARVHRELRGYWREHSFLRPLSPWARLRIERHNAAAFDRHVDAQRPDVVTWWGMGGLSLGLIGRADRAGLASLAFVSDDWLVYGPSADQWMRLTRRTLPEDGVHWLFVSEATRNAARAAGWRVVRSEIAHTGIAAAFLTAVAARDWAGRLLYVGRIDPRKGIAAAIRATAELPSPVRLTIVGEGDRGHLAELGELARGLGVAERVELVGGRSQAELPDIYAAHDTVLFPSRWEEPWGLVPLEAMGIGRPVVASGRGGSAEYLRGGENCLLADPDQPGTFAAAVRRLAGDAALRDRLRAGGFVTAARHSAAAFEARVVTAVERAGAGG